MIDKFLELPDELVGLVPSIIIPCIFFLLLLPLFVKEFNVFELNKLAQVRQRLTEVDLEAVVSAVEGEGRETVGQHIEESHAERPVL